MLLYDALSHNIVEHEDSTEAKALTGVSRLITFSGACLNLRKAPTSVRKFR